MNYKHVHMVGIGGVGMSALAQFLISRGVSVTGSDREESPITEFLHSRGIDVHLGHRSTLPGDTELVVYSDAVPPEDPERQAARERSIPEKSYFQMLGEVSEPYRVIAVAGTHGKTTTTGMIAATLRAVGESPTAIVGSVVRDLGSNFLKGESDIFVIEACEYRNHLLELRPEILVITNIELDHTDFFPTLESLIETFQKAVASVPQTGAIVTNPHDPVIARALEGAQARIIDYTPMDVPALKLVGEFNRDNARAAKASILAIAETSDLILLDDTLASFEGSWRRFEYKGMTPKGALVFDDYAHHPTAVLKTIAAARERYADKKITVVFHPHLYSRTRDLFDGFVDALATADRIIIAPIYAAREKDTGDMNNVLVANAIEKKNPHVLALASFDEIREELLKEAAADDLIITMGAGDIYKVAEQITDSV